MIEAVAIAKEVGKETLKEVGKDGLKEVGKEGLKKSSENLPNFSKDMDIDKSNSFQDADKPISKETINSSLEGQKHPVTGVEFQKNAYGVYPKFESKATVNLPENMRMETDAKQFKYCNDKLKEQLHENPAMEKQFTKSELKQIDAGRTPKGNTWHHNEASGKMELVDRHIHDKTAHTGGRSIWGGGQAHR